MLKLAVCVLGMALAGCGATGMKLYQGPPKAEADVVVIFADTRPSDVWLAAWGVPNERPDDLTVVFTSINGTKVKGQIGPDVFMLEPGEHRNELRIEDSRHTGQGISGPEVTMTVSRVRSIDITLTKGRYYFFTGAPPEDDMPWEPVATDVTDLAREKLRGIRGAAGY
jgi:hypothetical protein